jgi:hypothetical protein
MNKKIHVSGVRVTYAQHTSEPNILQTLSAAVRQSTPATVNVGGLGEKIVTKNGKYISSDEDQIVVDRIFSPANTRHLSKLKSLL